MRRRYFNWKLAAIVVIAVATVSAGAWAIRKYRIKNSSSKALTDGLVAYDSNDWPNAARLLGRYIAVNQYDEKVLMKYARALMKIRPEDAQYVQQAASAYRNVIRNHPDNLEAARKCVELYLMMGRFDDAELIGQRIIESSADPEIRRLHAIALVRKRKFAEAAEELKKLCEEKPENLPAYETTGQLAEQQPDVFSEPASYWFNEAVKKNPSSALAYVIRAGFYRRNNDSKAARADLETAQNQELSDPTVSLRIAGEYLNLNLLDNAEKILADVRRSSPKDQQLWQLSAQAALMSQSPERMTNTAQAGLEELSSEPWDFMPLAAELYIRSDKLDEGADLISRLTKRDFPPSIISYLQGLMSVQKGDFLKAVKQWEHSVESGNNSVRLRLELASAFSNLGDIQSAISQLHALVSERPDSYDGHLVLANLLARTANWAEAQQQAARALLLRPDSNEALLLQTQARIQMAGTGSSAQKTLDLQNAEALLSKLDSATGNSIEADLLRFQIEKQKGNYTGAHDLISQMKQKYPSQERISLAEAELLVVQNRINEATTVLRQAIESFPDSVRAVRYLAALLDSQDQRDGCAAVITEALKRIDKPLDRRDLTLLLASFYTRWGRQDEAYDVLNKIAEEFPSDLPTKRALLSSEKVIGNPGQAQKLVDEIKSLEGNDGWQWRYEQAKLWYFSKDFQDRYPSLVSLLQENLLSNPDDQLSRLLLAKAYEKAGEILLAIPVYREAINRSPNNIQIVTAFISALYKAREYDQANELLSKLPDQSLQNPKLQRIQLQNYLRQGHYDSASDILQTFLGNDPNNQDARLALALLDIQRGKLSESEQTLAELKTMDPNSPAIAAAQIQLYLKMEKPQDAIKICDELVNNQNDISAYIIRAKTYASLNQPEKALQDLDSAIALEPGNAQVWRTRSDFYSIAGRWDEALKDIGKAASLAPDDNQIRKRQIALLLTSDKPEMIAEGKNIIEQCLKTNPDDADLQLYKANSLLVEGTAPAIENARGILQKITQENPELSQAWSMLGEIMLKKGLPGTAMDYASRGLAYKPDNEDLLFLKARAESMRSPVLAIPTLKVLCDLNPDNVEAANFLANIYITAGEPDKAIDFLKNELTRCKQSNSRTYNIALAVATYKAGSTTEGKAQLDSFIKADPDDPAPLLAYVYLLKDDRLWSELKTKTLDWYERHPQASGVPAAIASSLVPVDLPEAQKTSEEIFREILKKDPKYTKAINSLALLLGMNGRSKEAADLYRKLIALEPENVVAINNLAWILCENQGQAQQALELAQKGLKLAPDYIDLLDTRGVAYFRLGQFQKAVQDFNKCIDLYPASTPQAAMSRFHLAKAYAGLKETNKAIQYLEEVLNSIDLTGGLSPEELAEAQSMLKQLQEDI